MTLVFYIPLGEKPYYIVEDAEQAPSVGDRVTITLRFSSKETWKVDSIRWNYGVRPTEANVYIS